MILLYMGFFNIHAPPLMCGILAFLGGTGSFCIGDAPPKTYGRQSRLSQQMELKQSQPMEFGA